MARPLRVLVPGAIHHVAAHASDQRALFRFDADREEFLERLDAVSRRYELRVVSYCLMGNHYHLLVGASDAPLSLALQRLHSGYSRSFNRSAGRRAHLFLAHPLCRLLESDADLLTASRYVVRNPVEAGLCGAPGEWPWSSYRATAGLEPAPGFLVEAALRDACGGGPGWRRRYRDFVTMEDPPPLPVESLLHFRRSGILDGPRGPTPGRGRVRDPMPDLASRSRPASR